MSENQLEILRQKLIDRVNRMNEQELNELLVFLKTYSIESDERADDTEQEVTL